MHSIKIIIRLQLLCIHFLKRRSKFSASWSFYQLKKKIAFLSGQRKNLEGAFFTYPRKRAGTSPDMPTSTPRQSAYEQRQAALFKESDPRVRTQPPGGG